jgi:hypothetical protein
MAWNSAAVFLEKFKKFTPPKKITQNQTIKIIKDILGVPLEEECVEKKGNSLFIKTKNPFFKSDIFLRKNQILRELEKKLGPRAPKEIKFN